MRTLDRIVHFDERSRSFPITDVLTSTTLRNKTWKCGVHLDQGQEGSCVGHAWAHELASEPYKVAVESDTAKVIYYAAQQFDEWEGVSYSGTSVLAGAKVVKALGHMPEYRWAFGIDEVLATLSRFGPVVLGINWYRGMFIPDAGGFITPTGDLAGGHAILATGVTVRERNGWWWKTLDDPIVRLHNSWGESYGVGGDIFIRSSDLQRLLLEDGDACVPVVRR